MYQAIEEHTAGDQKEVASAYTPPCMNDRSVRAILITILLALTLAIARGRMSKEFASLGHHLMALGFGCFLGEAKTAI